MPGFKLNAEPLGRLAIVALDESEAACVFGQPSALGRPGKFHVEQRFAVAGDQIDRKAAGDRIDSKAIKKHKNDVFRLYQIIDPTFEGEVPESIKDDLRKFIDRVRDEKIDLKALGLGGVDLKAVMEDLVRIYGLE